MKQESKQGRKKASKQGSKEGNQTLVSTPTKLKEHTMEL